MTLSTLHTMSEVAQRLHRSVRWLQGHLKDNPCGRFAGRRRLFTELDLARGVDGLNGAVIDHKRSAALIAAGQMLGEPLLEASNEPCEGYIYAVGFGPYVKIGYSKHPLRRIAHMQTALPEALILYFQFQANPQDERRIHRMFAGYRTRGEWFRLEGAVATWVMEMRR